MVKFAPSILAADFWRLGEQVKGERLILGGAA
jgi:pentose-5-phosphate-3-epimerase